MVARVGAQVVFLLTDTATNTQDVAVIVQRGNGRLGAHRLVHTEVLGIIVGVVIVGGSAHLEGGMLVIGVDRDVVHAVHCQTILGQRQAGVLVELDFVPAAGIRRVIPQADCLLMPQRRDVALGIVHGILDGRLDLGVHGGVDPQTAVEDHRLGLVRRHVQLLLQIVEQLIVERIGEVGVLGGTGGVLGGAAGLGQRDGLGTGGIVLILGDIPLGIHLIQHVVAPGDEVFRVGEGIVRRGVLGDGSQHRALRQGQILHMLAEIFLGARLHAADNARQRDGVQVGFQDGLLAVAVGKTQSAEYFAHLTHLVHLIVAGQVLDQLLLQRGSTLLGAVDGVVGELVEGRTDGTLDVDAGLVVEVLVLDGDDRMLQIFRHGRKFAPDTVFALGQRGVLVAVLVVDDGGLLVFLVVQVQDLAVIRGDLHDIHRQQHTAHTAKHDAHAEHAADEPKNHAGNTAAFLLLFLLGVLRIDRFKLPRGTVSRLCATHGKMTLLFGFYGNRLL